MQTIALHKWAVDNEPDLTREAYAQIESRRRGRLRLRGVLQLRHHAPPDLQRPSVLELLEMARHRPAARGVGATRGAARAAARTAIPCSFYLVGRIARGPVDAGRAPARQKRTNRSSPRATCEVGFWRRARRTRPRRSAASRACVSRCASWRRGSRTAPSRADPTDEMWPRWIASELETDRLRLRRFRESDLDAYARITGDPETMRYIARGEPFDREQAWRCARIPARPLADPRLRPVGRRGEGERRARRPDRPLAPRRLGVASSSAWLVARERWGSGLRDRGRARRTRARVHGARRAPRDQPDRPGERRFDPRRREARPPLCRGPADRRQAASVYEIDARDGGDEPADPPRWPAAQQDGSLASPPAAPRP